MPGSVGSESFMHDADTLSQLKRKLQSYDELQIVYTGVNKQDKKPEATNVEKNRRLHCINCGELHDTANCPHKDKGPRCFN